MQRRGLPCYCPTWCGPHAPCCCRAAAAAQNPSPRPLYIRLQEEFEQRQAAEEEEVRKKLQLQAAMKLVRPAAAWLWARLCGRAFGLFFLQGAGTCCLLLCALKQPVGTHCATSCMACSTGCREGLASCTHAPLHSRTPHTRRGLPCCCHAGSRALTSVWPGRGEAAARRAAAKGPQPAALGPGLQGACVRDARQGHMSCRTLSAPSGEGPVP